MRLIGILIALMVVGLLVARIIDGQPSADKALEVKVPVSTSAPKIPTKAQDVKGFEQQVNKFIGESESERAEQIERAQQ